MVWAMSVDTEIIDDLSFKTRSKCLGFSQFNVTYPKGATLSHKLSWFHVAELKYQLYLPNEDELRRELETVFLMEDGDE